QESRLDQSARSHTGAIGIMQMLPATASDPNVGIDDIDQTEPNIQAGMKYLNFLRERYFSDPDIDQANRTLMALAAYNVGPRRMINLRNKAARLGYDPNVWFDNVELVAARDIGREPVTYVANIVKYYTAYSHAIASLDERESAREQAGME
ncbi:MAG: transglycosylase SLT domain-containing protein, partial [Halieaceae bacterium]|nr:transglycosylase SLT domain-containing protein [Halieaceae bacterium]